MRKELFSIGELTVDSIIGGGVSPYVRRTGYLDPTNGTDGNTGKSIAKPVKTLAKARSLITTGKNDRIILLQNASLAGVSSGISLAADPAFTENMFSLIGSGPGMQGMRSRIGMASDYGVVGSGYAMINVGTAGASGTTGVGNLFANLYTMHGYSTTHVTHVGWLINGNYNTFKRCHLHGPNSTGLAGDASYQGVRVVGTGFQLFEDCTFGNLSVARSLGNCNVALGVGTCTLFRNCTFLAYLGADTPYFVQVENTSGLTEVAFENCKFYAMSSSMNTAMAEAIKLTGSATCRVYLDPLCAFDNVTLLTADATKAYVRVPASYTATANDMLRMITS